MTYEKEKKPKCYPKKKRKKNSCCRHVHLYIANILAAFSRLYTDAHCAEWINTQLTSGIKSLLFYMDLQEWVPFSSSYSIDCTFIPQIYSCKYCHRYIAVNIAIEITEIWTVISCYISQRITYSVNRVCTPLYFQVYQKSVGLPWRTYCCPTDMKVRSSLGAG